MNREVNHKEGIAAERQRKEGSIHPSAAEPQLKLGLSRKARKDRQVKSSNFLEA